MNYKSLIKECKSKSDFCKKLGLNLGGTSFRKINKIIENNNLDISHFDGGKSKRRKYEIIVKKCPVCNTEFKTKNNHPSEKTTCSVSCSNTYFRTGENNPNYKNIEDYDNRGTSYIKKYRKLCFKHHGHKCIICNENKILDVHHCDGNKFNNNINNLVPLCPTHHRYCHSKHKNLVLPLINEYLKKN